jgi:hypothetical protein
MPQVFHRSTNTVARVSIFGAAVFLGGALFLALALTRSSWATRRDVVLQQTPPFSHDHHVGQIGIDCRYCHTSVETSSSAGIPPTATCMNCHSQIWNDSPMLEPVRQSFASGKPLVWMRTHDVADFVYFDHSVHVNRGVGCVSCHGRVDRMPLMRRENSLQMEWCLNCHRHPERFVRPTSEVFNMQWEPPQDDRMIGERLVQERGIKSLTNCSTCHR